MFALTVIQGCTMLGPDYKEPTVEWLDTYQTDLYGQVQPDYTAQEDFR